MKKRVVVVLALLSAPVLATAFRDFAGMRDLSFGWNTANGSPSGPSIPSPTFDLNVGVSTPNDLTDALTVNSTSMTLVLACDAQGISGTNWTCRDAGGAVTLSGGAMAPSINTPFHALDSAERMTTAAATVTGSGGDITTEDIVVEAVVRNAATTTALVVSKKASASSTTAGWALQNNLGTFGLIVADGTVSATGSAPASSLAVNTFSHVIGFFDESSTAGLQTCLNGACGTAVDGSTVGSLTNASSLTVTGLANRSVVSFRVWKCSACINGTTENASIARNRSAVAFGVSPSIAAGVATPTALTRAAIAHTDVVDGSVRHLYQLGTNAPRVARRTHSGGTVVAGYLSEPAVSNIALQSQTLGTTWTAITVGDNVLADAYAGADLTVTGDNIDGNNSLGEHGLRQAITLTAATHTFSAWARAGAQNFVALRDNTIVSGTAWFNLTTCTSASCVVGQDCPAAVGTVQAGVSRASAERWPIDTTGDGVADVNLCRVSITYTGTAALNDHDLLCAPSDGVTSYTDADATADCGFWGVRVEAFPVATSYVATTAAPTARNADDIRFDGASHYTGSPSTMDVAVLCPSFDVAANTTVFSVGTGITNVARLGVEATGDRAQGGADVAGVQWLITAASGDVTDGAPHSLRQTMATNNITAYYDGASIGTDTTATLPTSASSFVYFGTAAGTAAAPACLISRARLWSSLVAP